MEAASHEMADGNRVRAGNLETQALDAQRMRTSLHVQRLFRQVVSIERPDGTGAAVADEAKPTLLPSRR